jgi:hypothetical protein
VQFGAGGFADLAPGWIVNPTLNTVEGVGAAGDDRLQIGETRAVETDNVIADEDAGFGVVFALEGEQAHAVIVTQRASGDRRMLS